MLCIYIIYSSINTTDPRRPGSQPFKLPSAKTPACTYTHAHTLEHTHTLVSFWDGCPHAARLVNILYIDSDFLWQIRVVVLVILSKLTVDFSDKWLKLVCIWTRQNANHLLQFLPKGVDYKNSCLPPSPVRFFMSFLFHFCSKKNVQKVEMYPGLSVFIYENNFFFSLSLWMWHLVGLKLTAPTFWQPTPSVVMVGLVSKFSWIDTITVSPSWCTLPSLDRFLP